MSVAAAEFATPFLVEFTNDSDTWTPEKRYFASRSAAWDFFHLKARHMRCVWIGEIGRYKDPDGQMQTDWMFFYWTDGTEYGTCPEPGKGCPQEDLYTTYSYTAYSDAEALTKD